MPFLQITFHAGCRHTHFWQGVAWMVRPICAHRARYRKLIVWLLDIYILEACAVIFRKAIVMLPEANFLSPWCESPSSRAQNRHFCALLLASFFPMAPPASNKPHLAEKYSGLASNLAYLGRIC